MDLPVMPPVEPMLARAVPEIPDVGHSEPKWDGFLHWTLSTQFRGGAG